MRTLLHDGKTSIVQGNGLPVAGAMLPAGGGLETLTSIF